MFTVFDLDKEKSRAQKYGWQEQTQSIFASVEMGYKSMLYLTVTGRNDWASQLAGSPQRSFFYPSVGLSWLPTATFDMPEAFTYLKLRASFSSVGIPFPRFPDHSNLSLRRDEPAMAAYDIPSDRTALPGAYQNLGGRYRRPAVERLATGRLVVSGRYE